MGACMHIVCVCVPMYVCVCTCLQADQHACPKYMCEQNDLID